MRNFFRFVGWMPFPGKIYLKKQFYKFHQSDDNNIRTNVYKDLKHTLKVLIILHGWFVVLWALGGLTIYKDSVLASGFFSTGALVMLMVTAAQVRLLRSIEHDYSYGIRKQLTGNPECTNAEKYLSYALSASVIAIVVMISCSV